MQVEAATLWESATTQRIFFGIVGAAAMWLFGLWQRKTTVLTYAVHMDRFAESADDVIFGNVGVNWQGRPVPNLYLATVTVDNPTLRDLDDLHLHAYVSVGLTLLTERSQVEGSPRIVPYDPDFAARVFPADGEAATPMQLQIYNSSRQYRLPVFNRGQRIRLSYLCTYDASAGDPPMIYVTGERKGTKLVQRPGALAMFGVPLKAAQGLGLVATVLVVLTCGWLQLNVWVAGIVSAVVGLFAQLVGAAIYRVLQRAKDLLAG